MANAAQDIPYLPISKFDADEMEGISVTGTNIDVTELQEFLDELPKNNTMIGRDKFSQDVALVICGMGMEKYLELFKSEDISLETFLKLTISDLEQMGISNKEDQEKIAGSLKDMTIIPTKQNVEKKEFVKHQDFSPAEDLLIARNVLKHVLLLENYASYTLYQMKKVKLVDYFVSKDKTAVGVLKLVTKKAVQQSERLINIIGLNDERLDKEENTVISSCLKANNMTLPKNLENKLMKSRPRKRATKNLFLKMMTIIGLSSVAVLVGKQIISIKE